MTRARRYYVDWSDSSFPEIRPYDDGSFQEPQTFTECKADIVRHFQTTIDHCRSEIRRARETRERDVRS